MTLTREQIEDRVKALAAFAISTPCVRLDARLDTDLNFDSLGRVELACDLEQEFDVVILDEVHEKWRTLRDVVTSIEQLLAGDGDIVTEPYHPDETEIT